MDQVKSVVCDEIEASVAKISAITSLSPVPGTPVSPVPVMLRRFRFPNPWTVSSACSPCDVLPVSSLTRECHWPSVHEPASIGVDLPKRPLEILQYGPVGYLARALPGSSGTGSLHRLD